MSKSGERGFISALGHSGLWFSSVLAAVLLLSLLLSLMWGGAGSILPIFRVATIFAFPVGCLYLPVLIAVRGSEKQRKPIIVLGGTLIGPASIALWSLVSQWRGGDPHAIWYGDPLIGVGGFVSMIFALFVGSLSTFVYVFCLSAIHRMGH